MSFFEQEFPRAIGFGAHGGPMFNTTVNTGFSGFEQRNRNWQYPLNKYDVSLEHKPIATFNLVSDFFWNVYGQADAFRFFDHKDYSATAQVIGVGNGSNKIFQLVKTYTMGDRTFTRLIKKPITASVKDYQGNALANTVKIYKNGLLQTLTTHYTIDYTTGIITFVTAPSAGSPSPFVPADVITADFQFHVPVRFSTDEMKAEVTPSDVYGGNALITWASIQLIEVRL